MGILSKILGGSAGEVVDKLAGAVDRFVTTDEERARIKLDFEKVLQARDSEIEQTIRAELSAQERILVAELTQGDNYTKRARPTIIYAGLFMMAWNYCLTPLFGVKELALPEEFWIAWGGVVGVYSWGRTQEKRRPVADAPAKPKGLDL